MKARTNHYLKPNEGNRIPRRHVFIDVESERQQDGIVEHRFWRLAVARFFVAEVGRRKQDWMQDFDTPESLWRAVDRFSGRRSRTVVWSHNLGIDTRLSDALQSLPDLGWTLGSHNITSRGTWFTWRKGEKSLVFVDSASVFGQPLPQIGKWFGLGTLRMPGRTAPRSQWVEHCTRNLLIMSTAVLSYLQWLDSADLGNWAMTGSGQAWAAYRHKFMDHKLLVHTDEEALAAERRAIWTGRTEAYWHGDLRNETVEDWDIRSGYATIGEHLNIPVRLVGDMPARYNWRRILDDTRIAFLADVTVRTAVPCVPARHDGHILWPVGQFDTTLWGPEISWALECGAEITVTRGWLYRAAPALQRWSRHILDQLGAPDSIVPAWQKDFWKGCQRWFVGRCAMRYASWEDFGDAPDKSVQRWDMYDTRTGQESELMQVGGKIWQSAGTVEYSESMPMITGYVMSATRVAISRIVAAMPPLSVLYVDTDSCLIRMHHHREMEAIAGTTIGRGLRLKASYDGITIWGPRQLVTGQMHRISGLPHQATRTGRHTFAGNVHTSLEKAVKDGQADRVTVTDRDWTIRGVDRRRLAGPHGWTLPVAVSPP